MNESQPFDLNAAINDWRARLADSPALQARDLFELEGHLRESIARLRSLQLSEEDYFVLAVHRLGSAEKLTAEFGKVHRRDIWLERVMWMLAGLLLWRYSYGLLNLAATGALLLTHYYHMSTITTSLLTVVVQAGLFIPSLIVCWRMLLRPPAFLPKCWRALFRHRLAAVLVLVVFSIVLTLSGKAVLTLLFARARPEVISQLAVAQSATMIATSAVFELFLVITFVILARRRLGFVSPRQTAQ